LKQNLTVPSIRFLSFFYNILSRRIIIAEEESQEKEQERERSTLNLVGEVFCHFSSSPPFPTFTYIHRNQTMNISRILWRCENALLTFYFIFQLLCNGLLLNPVLVPV
jgi:hypothetical protein